MANMISFKNNQIAKLMRESKNEHINGLYNTLSYKWHKLRDHYYFASALPDCVSVSSLLPPPSRKEKDISFFQAQLAARYLGIEAYYSSDAESWKLYEKIVSKEPMHSKCTFSNLVECFNNSKDIWSIVIDCDGKVLDGIHRLAIFIYNGFKDIHVKRTRVSYHYKTNNRWQDLINDWNFSDDEVRILYNKYIEIYNKVNS